jgi:tight adherence protein B
VSESQLRRRLRTPGQRRHQTEAILRPVERLSAIGVLDMLFARATRLVDPLRRSIAQSGLKVTVGMVVLASLCLAALFFFLTNLVTRLPLLGFFMALVGAGVPFTYVRWARSRRMLKFEENFPEAIDLLSRALRAGHALTTGLGMVADEIPPPVGEEFRLLFDQQNYGLPLPDALRNFAARIPILDARFFVTAVLTQREAGGNLSEVLDNLASIIRDRFRVKRQVRVISAHGRITGWVLALLPPSLAMAFVVLTPDNYRRFYNDPLGIQMIVGALLLQILGVLVIRRIVNIEI